MQKEYNLLSYNTDTCTKQAADNYKMPVKFDGDLFAILSNITVHT